MTYNYPNGDKPCPNRDDIIYLLGHGDDPKRCGKAHELRFGGKTASELAIILQNILKPLRGEKFNGQIVLEGCHSAVPLSKGSRVLSGTSMLAQFQTALEKIAKNSIDPSAKIAGYLGMAFDSPNHIFGIADIDDQALITRLSGRSGRVAGPDAVTNVPWRQQTD